MPNRVPAPEFRPAQRHTVALIDFASIHRAPGLGPTASRQHVALLEGLHSS